jgi:putative transposase
MPDVPLITDLPEHLRTQALQRFALIQPFLQDGVALTTLAQQHAVSLRTLRRWVALYRRLGLVGLSRPVRADRGSYRRVTPELQAVIEGLALRAPALSVAAIYRQIVTLTRTKGWAVPSYGTVYTIVRRLPAALTTLAHEGLSAYSDQFELVQRYAATRANEVWQADHTPLDIWVLDDRQQPARPWLTVILDDYSRAVAGYFLSLQHPSALHTSLALRQAIWRKEEAHWHICGIPETFYTDHGSDFTSRHIEQVCADLKIRLQFAHSARSKGKVERFFATVNQLFLCEQPGYTPPGTAPAVATLAFTDFVVRWHRFVIETYLSREHSEIQMAPQARWDAGGFLPQMPHSLEQLDLLLLTVAKTRQVQRDGIRFAGSRYTDPTLSAFVGEAVIIRYDPRDMAEIRVYHEDRFLCRAICHDLAGESMALKDLLQIRQRRRRELKQTIETRTAQAAAVLPPTAASPAPAPAIPDDSPADSQPRLKRYYHE